ncbi:unnamed protein product [Spirodela intermedia]|uniref:Uncharacterized protein n=1 Tax=Spirodela intermedia TaxID=51605 RepID=A0A7I8JTH5_SPIIN|nr:unnamed protein product [Spirodela intermedia]CAA6673458.1 unnamed protein product [Spirodela intermedia]
METFDAYFRRADLDMDGRISGAEAVAFFQGSNLPKQILAQIWMYCDSNKTGFLGRKEFYNALRLVTVSQRGQELTPEIVKAALEGPVSAQIPPPQINTASVMATPGNQIGIMPSASPQNPGFRGPQVLSNANVSQQVFPSEGQYLRPNQATSAVSYRPLIGQGIAGGGVATAGPRRPLSNNPNILTDWPSGRTGGTSVGGPLQVSQGSAASVMKDGFGSALSGLKTSAAPRAVGTYADTLSLQPQALDSRQSIQPSVTDSKTVVTSGNGFNSVFGADVFTAVSQPKQDGSSNAPTPSLMGSMNSGMQTSFRPVQNLQTQSSSTVPHGGSQLPGTQLLVKQRQNEPAQSTSAHAGLSSISSGRPWPRFSQTDVQKYSKVFVEVDTDKDGKITGEQARNLFLSWKLPREVLKQVWDLSDQDNDSMLSHREFVIALYLMERHREGYPLPAVLPNSIKFDEIFTKKPKWSSVGEHLAGHLRKEDQNGPNLNFQEETDPNEKMQELEKEILDSKEKINFYRSKMQELVLYKSKCDNKLNEITEKASADKREVEFVAKKYDEKYKQVGDLASKLTIEEAAFRDTQQRKSELHNAITTMEKGGSADGLLQVRADRIHADLEGLLKALNERCKKHALDIKSTGILELPFGWELGVQEGATEWDEDWDKFEDEGFSLAKEQDNYSNTKHPSAWIGKSSMDDVSSVTSSTNADMEKPSSFNERASDNKSAYAQSEDGSMEYPSGSQFQEFPSAHFDVHDASPRAVESPRDHVRDGSTNSMGNFADDTSWGAAFDMSNDGDSVSDFSTKESYNGSRRDSFFETGDFGLNPIRTGSPAAVSEYGRREKATIFADSVPGTPQLSYSSSPHFSEGPESNNAFDAFGRFDSFSTTNSGFDSIRSTSDQSQGFGFDDSDPFGYTGPFKALESSDSKRDSSKWSAF